MTELTTPPSNGRPRRMLSDQLDRLDTVINDLEEALPAAIGLVVRDVLHEVIKEMQHDRPRQPCTCANGGAARPDPLRALADAAMPLLAALRQVLAVPPHPAPRRRYRGRRTKGGDGACPNNLNWS